MWWQQWDKIPMSTSKNQRGKHWSISGRLLFPKPHWFRLLSFSLEVCIGKEGLYVIYFVKGGFPSLFPSSSLANPQTQ